MSPFRICLALILLALPAAAASPLTSACQSACGNFGDPISCSACLRLKDLKPANPAPLDQLNRNPASTQEEWERQHSNEDLLDSRRKERQLCIDTNSC